MKIVLINGPNLNLLGLREPSVYGRQSFEDYLVVVREELNALYPALELVYFQSNSEAVLLDLLHEYGFSATGIVLNAGAYSHTSLALGDAVRAISTPVVEVHISNVYAREVFRHHSHIAPAAAGVLSGFGLQGYRMAIDFLVRRASQ